MKAIGVLALMLGLALPVPGTAQVNMQKPDALFRAAYCIGVLKATRRYMHSPEYRQSVQGSAQRICELSSNKPEAMKNLSNVECENAYVAEQHRYIGDKQQRNLNYMYVLTLTPTHRLLANQITLIMAKGERDYATKKTQANVMTCIMLLDRPPN